MRVRLALGGTFLGAGFIVAGAALAGCGSGGGGSAGSIGESSQALATLPAPPPLDAGTPPDSGPITVTDAGPPPFEEDGGGDGGSAGPSGYWHFDDCSPKTTSLIDSSGNGDNAEHRIGSSCVAGISGLGVSIDTAKNVVEIPDAAQFALSDRIAVSAWINPTKVSGTQPILIKELDGESAFELYLSGGSVYFSVRLSTGKTIKSSAPISANAWSNVGAYYDGQFVFLFLNGEQVGQVDAPGTLRDVKAPIRVGASAEGAYFDGVIDEVWISTNVVSASVLQGLACIPRQPSLAISQSPTGAVQQGTTVNYSIAVTNNDVGFCQPESYFFSANFPIGEGPPVTIGGGGGDDAGTVALTGPAPVPAAAHVLIAANDAGPGSDAGPDAAAPTETPLGLEANVTPFFLQSVAPGQAGTFDVTVAASVDTDPGNYPLSFQVFSEDGDTLSGTLDFDLAAPSGCFVTTGRELMVIDPTVVDDPVRTAFTASATNPSTGVWTFGRLMRDMAPTPDQAPAFTLALFQSWLTDQPVNGFTVTARPAIQQQLLDIWPKTADGSLDLTQSPLRLSAIVNRIDTRDLAAGNAGEARFVYGVLDQFGNPQQFTVIAEYALLANTEADVLNWANEWHALGALPFPSEQYNAALEALTLQFSGRGAAPSRPNGSALDQLRTNEIALSFQWELRQFGISATTGLLTEETIALTPDLSLNGTNPLADFINQNQATVIANTDTLPLQFEGAPFIGGSVFNNLITWNAPGIDSSDARFQFSSNTCNGCHGPDTNTTFLQIAPRFTGQESVLSPFLTGTTAFDQVTGAPIPLNDLQRRNADLASLVCTAPAPAISGATAGVRSKVTVVPAGPGAGTQTTVAKGIRRTH